MLGEGSVCDDRESSGAGKLGEGSIKCSDSHSLHQWPGAQPQVMLLTGSTSGSHQHSDYLLGPQFPLLDNGHSPHGIAACMK